MVKILVFFQIYEEFYEIISNKIRKGVQKFIFAADIKWKSEFFSFEVKDS
jgi:hypothetical protein